MTPTLTNHQKDIIQRINKETFSEWLSRGDRQEIRELMEEAWIEWLCKEDDQFRERYYALQAKGDCEWLNLREEILAVHGHIESQEGATVLQQKAIKANGPERLQDWFLFVDECVYEYLTDLGWLRGPDEDYSATCHYSIPSWTSDKEVDEERVRLQWLGQLTDSLWDVKDSSC
ncbi:MAG TPA: hypothetical protein ACN46M_03485 [Prochlorococcus sp.]|tara:strand:+ start:2802 stop:3323 length:522 start_codon:yes stop_codon:yes gene_type:complete